MTARTAAPWLLAIGASVCLGLSLLVLEGRGPKLAALIGFALLQGASLVLGERSERDGSRWFSPLIVVACVLAVALGVWLGRR